MSAIPTRGECAIVDSAIRWRSMPAVVRRIYQSHIRQIVYRRTQYRRSTFLCCAQCCCGQGRRRARARRETKRKMVIQNDYPSWRRQLRHTSPQRSLSPVSKGAVALPLLLPRSPPTTTTNSTMQAIRLQKKYPEVTQEEMFDLINRFKCVNVIRSLYAHRNLTILCFTSSAIPTETQGRVDKAAVISAVQQSGESYDRARETLKHVSVDASGKVELEDWVEVRRRSTKFPDQSQTH